MELVNDKIEGIDLRTIFMAARSGDELVKDVLDKMESAKKDAEEIRIKIKMLQE